MIRRIILQNYMSHADTTIEPATGLTVLVGPNNCGKSAVVSALETLCNNALGDYMVRHDEKEVSVTVETDDGHTLVWKRRGNTVSYIIKGSEINRLKGGIPEDLHKFLRLPKVDAGEKDPFDIHFGSQKSPIFLLNESESRIARFFASSSDAAILLKMQKRHRNKVKERKSDAKRLNGEIEKLDAELDALEPLDGLAELVAKAEGQYQGLKGLEGQIQARVVEMETLRAHSVKHDRLVQEYECLAPLKSPPDLANTSPLESLIIDLVDAEHQFQRAKECCLALESLNLPPVLDDVQQMESVCRALSQEEKNHRLLNAKVVCLGRLNDPPVIDDPGSLEKMVADLESAQLTNVARSRQQGVLESLTPPPELTGPQPLAELIRQLEIAFRNVARHKGLMEAAAADMDEGSLLHGPAERPLRRRMLIASGFAGMAAVILLLILGPTWFNRLNTGSTDGAHKMADLAPKATAKSAETSRRTENVTGSSDGANQSVESTPKAAAKADDKAKTENITGSSQGVDKSIDLFPKAVAKTDDKAKTGNVTASPAEAHKTIDPTPKEAPKADGDGKTRNRSATHQATEEARQPRLKAVRRLLKDAEMASEKGKYLDAVLGYGQAAVLYPQELAEVENPEKVRLQFMDALKRYQVEVERALQKAAKQKADDRQPDPKTSDPNSR
jgi:exonuclease SbcC